MRPKFTRASIATVVNSQDLIEVVPADTPRFDHDPVTGVAKGLLLEEARTNLITRSTDLTLWTNSRVTISNSTVFPIFANEGFFLLTGDGASGAKGLSRFFLSSPTTRTISFYLRHGTNNFAQILTGGGPDLTIFANYYIFTGVVGSRGAGAVSSTMIPWRDDWYRCTLTFLSSTTTSMNAFLVSSATASRGEGNTLNTSIYVAGAQIEDGIFATSDIPTDTATVTRAADDFAEVEVPYPAQLDLLGAAVTRGHIGLPLASGETAGVARLGAEVGGLREWGGELLSVS
jgi:hypothetical protein